MIKIFVKKFIKNHENIHDKKVRQSYIILGSILGIICNLVLFSLKLIIGLIIHSMSVLSDAFNNLSDSGSSIIGLFSAKLSNKKPDKDHPFGHGRIEYIASLIVSFLIIFMGAQLLITSINKLTKGQSAVIFNPILVIILSISILIKLWMFFYNRYLSKQIDSLVLKATALDSISDVITSSLVIISLIVGKYVSFPLDGVMGILMSLLIIYNGFKLTIETSGTLLGKKANEELIKQIEDIFSKEEKILGTHDLIVHDYGPGRQMASIHVEISDKENIVAIHELIDDLEKKIEEELFIHMVIHMDPISIDNEELNQIHDYLNQIILETQKDVTFHDLRMTQGEKNKNIIFDLSIPYQFSVQDKNDFISYLKDKIKEKDERYSIVINIDYH